MEKARIKKLFERFKNGTKLTYRDGPYQFSVGGYDLAWEFYVNDVPYVQEIIGRPKFISCHSEADEYAKFLNEIK